MKWLPINWIKRWVKIGGVILAALFIVLIVYVRFTYGGGEAYPDLTTAPKLGPDELEIAVISPRAVGNAAVDAQGRVYYTIHPESHPDYPKLYRAIDGKSEPFPATGQEALFESPLGLVVDHQNRLWVVDPAEHGTGQPKLVALDLETGKVVHSFDFPKDIAPLGSFVQDLQIDAEGKTIYLADVGFWARRPAIIVYDVEAKKARRLLNRDKSVMPQNWLIRNPIKDMTYFGGLVSLKAGVDGIALSRDGVWLYYGAMSNDTMYRIRTADLKDASLDRAALKSKIEAVGKKPLNDGLSTDDAGNIYVTDAEHLAVLRMKPDGSLETLVKDDRIRWADGLSFGPDGWLYLADSAIPHLALQSQKHIAANAPYFVWRFKPGATGAPGQ